MNLRFFAAASAAALVAFSAHAQSIVPGTSGLTPGGISGDVQTNNGAGALAGVTVLPVPHGGSGAATLTAHGVLVGEGASAFTATPVGTAGQLLTSNGPGVDPTFQTLTGTGCTTTCNYTGTQTITVPTATPTPASILVGSGGDSAANSDTTSALNLSWVMNTSGAADLIKLSATCTLCTSVNLINLYGGASANISRFKVDASGNMTIGGNLTATSGTVTTGSTSAFSFSGRGLLTSPAAATIQLGNADAASPTAQTLEPQNVVAGTSNTAGANETIQGSRGTGTGAGGDILFKVAPAGATGSTQNALVTAMTISNKGVPVRPGFTVAGLPSAPPTGAFAYVTDATACTFLSTVTGGGATFCPVVYNGAAWVAA